MGTYGIALAAGLLAALNPCGFALLPAYLAMVVESPRGGRPVLRALTSAAAMTVGFVAVFGGFGLVVVPLAVSVERYLPWVSVLIGIALVGAGGWLLAGRELAVRAPRIGAAPRSSTFSWIGYGVAYAGASLSCTIGPFLALTTSTLQAGDIVSGVGAFVAYALGMGSLVAALAVAVALARQGLVGRIRRLTPVVTRASGLLLLLAGGYVAWYGWYEVRLLGGRTSTDPVVGAVLAAQRRLIRAVDEFGAGSLALTLAAVLTALLVASWVRHRIVHQGSLRTDPDATRAPGVVSLTRPDARPEHQERTF